MRRVLATLGALAALIVVLVAGRYAYRSLMLFDGRTPEGFELLTRMPGAAGFEPTALPPGPRLENQASGSLDVEFGYKVDAIPYSYSLDLAFPASAQEGKASVTVRHATRSQTVTMKAVRRWDTPRGAYAVALEPVFDMQPSVPALCIKTVIGPSLATLQLKDGSICVARRDRDGQCHPETLACGLVRN